MTAQTQIFKGAINDEEEGLSLLEKQKTAAFNKELMVKPETIFKSPNTDVIPGSKRGLM